MRLTDYISNEPLKEGMGRVSEKVENNAELQDLARRLLHTLYDLNDRTGFLELLKENKGLFQSFELKQLRDEYDAVKTKNDAIAFNEKVIEMIGKRDTRFDDSGVPWGDQKEFEDDKIPEPEKKKEAIGIY